MLLDLTGEETAPHSVTEGWIKFIGQPFVVAHTHHSAVAARIVSSNCPVTSRIPTQTNLWMLSFHDQLRRGATIPVGMNASG